jgi:hypothetical protein
MKQFKCVLFKRINHNKQKIYKNKLKVVKIVIKKPNDLYINYY